jgi:hypothetical protein
LWELDRCDFRHDYKYVQRIPEPYRTPPQVRGSAVHEGQRLQMRRKVEIQELPTPEEVRDVTADAFEREWAGGDIRLSDDEMADGLARVKAHQKDAAVALSGLYRATVAPAVNPIGFERRISVKPKDMDVTLTGTLDVIDSTPDGEMVRDLKTAEKAPPQHEARYSPQLTHYGLLRLAETGALPPLYQLDVVWRTPKTLTTDYRPLRTTRDMTDMHTWIARLNLAIERVKKGVLRPAVAGRDWWCSPTACGYWEMCPFGARGLGARDS